MEDYSQAPADGLLDAYLQNGRLALAPWMLSVKFKPVKEYTQQSQILLSSLENLARSLDDDSSIRIVFVDDERDLGILLQVCELLCPVISRYHGTCVLVECVDNRNHMRRCVGRRRGKPPKLVRTQKLQLSVLNHRLFRGQV